MGAPSCGLLLDCSSWLVAFVYLVINRCASSHLADFTACEKNPQPGGSGTSQHCVESLNDVSGWLTDATVVHKLIRVGA